MSKTRKSVKIEEIQNNDSDSEIEIRPQKQQPIQPPIQQAPTVQPIQPIAVPIQAPPVQQPIQQEVEKKPRKKYTMSEETRKQKSEAMQAVRAKKMNNVDERKKMQDEIFRQAEEQLQSKVMKKIEAEKKKREKALFKQYMEAETKHKEKPQKVEQQQYVEPIQPQPQYVAPQPQYIAPVKPKLNYF